jgi:transcriptional regulator with XRE-family HTH domain
MSQSAIGRLERRGANPTVATLHRVLGATGHRLELRAEERPSSVDETLIASYLRLSPAERLAAFQESHASLARLKQLAAASG